MRGKSLLLIGAALVGCGRPEPPAAVPTAAPPTAAAPAAPEVRPPAAGQVREISFDDIKLDMEKGSS